MSMLNKTEPGWNVIVEKYRNEPKENVSSEEGRQIDDCEDNDPNTSFPIEVRREPDSKLIMVRCEQEEKHFGERCSTAEGIKIDASDEQFENADSRICASREPSSKKTLDRMPQPEKQFAQISSIERGMQME
jgi:hypothetical protein